MKKLMFFAMAAMVALASCSKTELINTEAPKEIGFKAVTGSITKAEESGTLNVNTKLGVFAYVNGTEDLYFGNTEFTKSGENFTGGKFWPLQSSLDFIVYAPYDGTDGNVTLNEATKELTVNVDNSNVTSINNQKDYLYGAAYYNNSGLGFEKNTTSNGVTTETIVPTALKHALAKITVSLTASNVTINKVELVSPTMSGSYTVNYTDVNPTPNWTPATPAAESTFANFEFSTLKSIQSTTENPATATESIMVVPKTEATSIIINYTLNGASISLDAEVNLNTSNDPNNPAKWAHGTHYNYIITIDPQGIKFDVPEITDWSRGTGLNETIN